MVKLELPATWMQPPTWPLLTSHLCQQLLCFVMEMAVAMGVAIGPEPCLIRRFSKGVWGKATPARRWRTPAAKIASAGELAPIRQVV